MSTIRPDLLAVSSSQMDFPIWRQLIRRQRERFANVLCVMYHTGGPIDLVDFTRQSMPEAQVLDIGSVPKTDWRNVAVNLGLQAIDAAGRNPWVLFMEQDFLIPDPDKFFGRVFNLDDDIDVVGFIESGQPWDPMERLHPAFILVRRDLVEVTGRDFAAHPDDRGLDHFGVFSADLHRLGAKLATLQELGLQEHHDWVHLAGCSQNYSIMLDPGGPNHRPLEFQTYLRETLKVDVPLHPQYVTRVVRYLESL